MMQKIGWPFDGQCWSNKAPIFQYNGFRATLGTTVCHYWTSACILSPRKLPWSLSLMQNMEMCCVILPTVKLAATTYKMDHLLNSMTWQASRKVITMIGADGCKKCLQGTKIGKLAKLQNITLKNGSLWGTSTLSGPPVEDEVIHGLLIPPDFIEGYSTRAEEIRCLHSHSHSSWLGSQFACHFSGKLPVGSLPLVD